MSTTDTTDEATAQDPFAAGGDAAVVFSAVYGLAEEWDFAAGSDESLIAIGWASHRRQSLRWNAAAFVLEPEGTWRPAVYEPIESP